MSKNLADIEQFTLYIPKLWEKDWAGAIDMAAGAQKEILVYQARAANLLKNITDRQATFEKLAWLTMWTKAFTIADSLHGTLDRNSQYILEIISRSLLSRCCTFILLFNHFTLIMITQIFPYQQRKKRLGRK